MDPFALGNGALRAKEKVTVSSIEHGSCFERPVSYRVLMLHWVSWMGKGRIVWAGRVLAWLLLIVPLFAGTSAGRFSWKSADGTIEADIEGWPLNRLLEKVSAKTRWQIYVEPKLDKVVSAKFKSLQAGEALSRLLSGLSYILIPAEKGGPARLYIYRTSMQAATDLVAVPQELEEGAAESRIKNELVVRLKPGTKGSIEDIAKQLGAKIVGRADELGAYRLQFTDSQSADAARSSLGSQDEVASVESNYQVTRPEPPLMLGQSSLPPLNLKPSSVADSGRVIVGLVDTAVVAEGTPLKDFLISGQSATGSTGPVQPELTHGTSMALTMLYSLAQSGASKDGTPVRILPVDVYGGGESTTTFEIAKGIADAVNGGASIVNLSLGGDGDSQFVKDVVKAAHEKNIIFVGAAGNEPTTLSTYPAAYPEVVAVTASGRGGQLASYANRGSFVDVIAPGTSLVPFQGQTYAVVGTSSATADISGVAAGLLSASPKDPAAVEKTIRQQYSAGAAVNAPTQSTHP